MPAGMKSVSEEFIVIAEEFWNKETELEGDVQIVSVSPLKVRT